MQLRVFLCSDNRGRPVRLKSLRRTETSTNFKTTSVPQAFIRTCSSCNNMWLGQHRRHKTLKNGANLELQWLSTRRCHPQKVSVGAYISTTKARQNRAWNFLKHSIIRTWIDQQLQSWQFVIVCIKKDKISQDPSSTYGDCAVSHRNLFLSQQLRRIILRPTSYAK